MTDILVRICVGLCGSLVVFIAGGVSRDTRGPGEAAGCMVLFILGLITILRALGVL